MQDWGRWMRDVATVHVLGQLPKYQLARMVLNHSDVSVRCSDLTHGENRSWCEYISHLYSRAPHHQVLLEIVVQCQLALPTWLLNADPSSRKLQPHV